MRTPPVSRGLRQQGFSLIELLVAFVILTLSMVAIYAVLSAGGRTLQLTRDYATASYWAQSKFAALGISESLLEGERSGRFGGDFHWQSQTSIDGLERRPERSSLPLYRVQLMVRWERGGRTHRLRFETLKLPEAAGLVGLNR